VQGVAGAIAMSNDTSESFHGIDAQMMEVSEEVKQVITSKDMWKMFKNPWSANTIIRSAMPFHPHPASQ
jgi:hypothetical protein